MVSDRYKTLILEQPIYFMSEYRRIAEEIAPCKLMITNFQFELPSTWPDSTRESVIITDKCILDLGIDLKNICLLDSESPHLLQPSDGALFTHFLLGGILGNGKKIIQISLYVFLCIFYHFSRRIRF